MVVKCKCGQSCGQWIRGASMSTVGFSSVLVVALSDSYLSLCFSPCWLYLCHHMSDVVAGIRCWLTDAHVV